jgi:histidinol phosphatase-like PHP family hydrolase
MSRVDVNIKKENYDKVIQLIEKNNGKIEYNSELKKYYHIIVEIEENIGWDIISKYSINSHI